MRSRVNRPIVLAALLAASFSIAGCRGCRTNDAAPGGASAPAPAAATGTPAAAADAAPPAKPVPLVFPPVVARVNGEEIYRGDLERAVRGIETQLKQRVPGDKRDGIVRGVLDRLINYRLLLQEARRRGIEVPPADIDAQLEGLARQFKTPEQLRDMLVMRGVTVDMLREDARRDLRVARLVALEAGSDIKIPVEDVRKFYDENLERFRLPESIRASHVFVRMPAGADDKVRHAMRMRAESIGRLAKRGDDFGMLAKNYSDDRATGVVGGELGWFSKGTTPKEFDEAVFKLQPGDIGGPIEATDGLHIVRITGRQPSRIQPFEEVQTDLASFLLREMQDKLTSKLIAQLREKAAIEILL
jgi:peptidyl-prolyl cis-trans isomerase C